MKKFSVILVVFAMMSCFNISHISAENTINGGNEIAPEEVGRENDRLLEEKTADMEEYLQIKSKLRVSGSKRLAVSTFQQDNSYYCGPASVQMAIHYITGTKVAQSTLAKSMGTTSSQGTYVYKMANELKSRTGKPYAYTTTSQKNIGNALVYSIDMNMPLVFHVKTQTLNPAYSFNNGHYVVGNGYAYAASGASGYSNVTYIDPWYGAGILGPRTISINTMQAAVNANAGYYIW